MLQRSAKTGQRVTGVTGSPTTLVTVSVSGTNSYPDLLFSVSGFSLRTTHASGFAQGRRKRFC